MVKMRKGRKRVPPNPPENEPPDIEWKKQKLDSETTSKYFNKESVSPEDHMKDSGLELDGDVVAHNSDSNGSAVCNRSKRVLKIKDESDSDGSSSDDFMKVPFSLNDLGNFKTFKQEPINHLQKDKNVSTYSESRLSDESDDEKVTNKQEYYDFTQIMQSQELMINAKKEELEKVNREKLTLVSHGTKSKSESKSNKKLKVEKKYDIKSIGEELGISDLLAMAEGPSIDLNYDSESSEDEGSLKAIKTEETYSVPKEGVQVTIELPNKREKKKCKPSDIEAAMKRRINLIRKENQVFMHKVHVLCWIAHGIYLNRVINNNDLMGLALSLIPSKHCYPPKHADLSYLEKLTEWFVKKLVVDKDHKLCLNSSKLPLLNVLETQINLKVAFSERDLVLIFVCMIRSLGISARLIVSLRPVPLRPPASDLISLSNKPKEEKSSNDSKPNKSKTKVKQGPIEKADEQVRISVKGKQKDCVRSINNQDETSCKINKVAIKEKKTSSIPPKKGDTGIKSPYFSSSDEVPLKELTRRSVSTKSLLASKVPKEPSSKESTLQNDKIIKTRSHNGLNSRSRQSTSTLDETNVLKEVKNKRNTRSTVKNPSPYFSSEVRNNTKQPIQEKASIKSTDIKKKTEAVKVNTRYRSVPASHREINCGSSEDEVEFSKGLPKQKKNNTTQNAIGSKSKIQKKRSSMTVKTRESDDSDFEPPRASTSRKKPIDRRVLSSDDEGSTDITKKVGNDFWAEVFLESEEKWISIDLRKGKIHCIQKLYSGATQPVRYVLAYNNDGTVKDITRRYAPQWLTVTRRLRVDDNWWLETLAPHMPHVSHREREEDEDLDRQMHDKPLPTSIGEYKNHPLFALRRHLLKFEAIYPPDAPTLGFVRGEPVYSRGCVTDLHTRETWIKDAKLVRKGEEPYKIVKARPKWDKFSQTVINDLPLPLFGHWQVDDYIPPPAVDGKVPRNEYGNVELYKPCMLPPGTVHLQVPQLARVARKLEIDCAPAVVGWEFSGCGSHPVLDGFIVCEEVKDVLLDAWKKEMDESARRAKERVEQRVYANWRRLIKGLLIKERLKARYAFGEPTPEKKKKKKKKKQDPKPGTSKS